MTDLSGFLNIVIAIGCLFVFYACATRAETKMLRLAMFLVLGLMILERMILGVSRLIDPTGEAVTVSLYVLNPIRILFILSIFGLGMAILRLDRPPEKR